MRDLNIQFFFLKTSILKIKLIFLILILFLKINTTRKVRINDNIFSDD